MGSASSAGRVPLANGVVVRYRFTDRRDGDLHIGGPSDELSDRRERIAPGPWTWLRQVHGDHVVLVDEPGQHAGVEADGAVTTTEGAVLAVHTADCAPVLIMGSGPGVTGIAAVHAGWKGLEAGVLDRAVDQLKRQGIDSMSSMLGPCIHAGCYEFGVDDLDRLAERFGSSVAGSTRDGRPALDMVGAVRSALSSNGVDVDASASICTGCDENNFSHRVRRDGGRQALVAWLERDGGA